MSTEIISKDIRDTKSRIFFIVGTSRSGSTLLQSMLSVHSDIVVPPETHFFHSVNSIQKKFREAVEKKDFSKKLINFWYDHKTRIRDLGLSKEQVLELAEREKISDPVGLFNLQLTMYRKERDKKIIGEKTPRHILKTDEILEAYPEAKIISMFRDPRAAANSEIKARFGSPSVIVTTRRWRSYVEKHEQLKAELPDNQYMMLRYSDLIEDTDGVLHKICSFLGVSFEKQMLEYYKRDEEGFAKGEKSWKKGTLKPIQKDKNEEWKFALKKWQVSLVEDIAGEHLNKMGYQSKEDSLPFIKKLFYQCVDFSKSIWATLSNERDEGYKDSKTFKF